MALSACRWLNAKAESTVVQLVASSTVRISFEIALRYDAEAYRTVLAVQLGKKIYVLHAFQKKSKKGIETPKHDVELITQRYAKAKERAKNEEK